MANKAPERMGHTTGFFPTDDSLMNTLWIENPLVRENAALALEEITKQRFEEGWSGSPWRTSPIGLFIFFLRIAMLRQFRLFRCLDSSYEETVIDKQREGFCSNFNDTLLRSKESCDTFSYTERLLETGKGRSQS